MMGHGEKWSRKREQAILALLTEPTIEKAAHKCGISAATLGRWLKETEFCASYEAARRRIVQDALSRLQHVSGEAVDALRRNLDCGQSSVEVRAALGILEQTLKIKDVSDFDTRLTVLENLLTTYEKSHKE